MNSNNAFRRSADAMFPRTGSAGSFSSNSSFSGSNSASCISSRNLLRLNKTAFSLLALSAVALTLPAQADTYMSIEGSSVSLQNSVNEELNPGGMRFRLGTQISEVFDIEGHFGFSFSDDTQSYDELGAAYMGAYLKSYVPVGHRSALFGLAGWTTVSISQSVRGSEFSDERAGFSWGFGMETQLTENLDLTADYVSYLRDEGLFEGVSAVSVGLKLYF